MKIYFLILALLLIFFTIIAAYWEKKRRNNLKTINKEIYAEIINSKKVYSPISEGIDVELDIKYIVNNIEYQKTERIPLLGAEQFKNPYKIGNKIKVYYDENNPNHVYFNQNKSIESSGSMLVFAWLIIMAIFLLYTVFVS